ncbi:MAG: hypothetical protein ABI600_16850 [Luteolibacter sp.]
MSGLLHRRFWVLLISLVVGFGCLKFLPGTDLDRAVFTTVVGSFSNPPLFVEGKGSHDMPWKLGSMTDGAKVDPRQAPVIVSLGDDPAGFFQASPLAPIDLAVVFSNFHRLGARKVATAAVFTWEAPDVIGLAALDKALGRFDSLVMAAPLSRGAVPSSMPAVFRRASVSLESVQGDSSTLPQVNRIPLPGVFLGGGNVVAGFSILESESAAGCPPLMARWEDRVVFAFPLLAVLQRNNLPIAGVEIHLGEYLKLSPNGPTVPLDAYGRLAVPVKVMAAFKEISAEALIDGGDDLFPKTAPDPVILRDDQSAAEPATRAFSKNLSAMIAALASDEGFARSNTYPRLTFNTEFCTLLLTALGLALLCGLADFQRHISLTVLGGAILSAQWIGVGMASVWLPGLPILASILAAVIVSIFIVNSAPKAAPDAIAPAEPPMEPEVPTEPEPTPAPKEKKPRAPRVKKAPAGTIPPQKTTTKKTAAKKAATPRKPRAKKPPTES